MTKVNAFLDSSVILSRKFGVPKEKKAVDKAIEKHTKLSTEYVKTEINRTFLTDIIFLHSLLVDEADLHIVYQRLRKYPITQRKKDRCLAIMESISDKKQLRIADAIVRLENLILGIEKELFSNIELIKSGTNCPLATEKVKFNYPIFEITTSCTRRKPSCSLPEYVQSKVRELKTLHVGISSNSNLKKLHKTLGEVLKEPKKAKGRNCQVMGDTIICLDAPRQCTIFSTNAKDFAPICRLFRKTFKEIKY